MKDGHKITTCEVNVKDAIDVMKLGCYSLAEATCPFNTHEHHQAIGG
jgi:hypothetical protein